MTNRAEDALQKQVVKELRARNLHAIWWATLNEGKRNHQQNAWRKAMGALPGVPDLIFIGPRGLAYFIELKSAKGRLSASQREFAERIGAIGLRYAVCRTLQGVEDTLREWGII